MDIGEVARRAGVSVSTLRFYEQKGLIASTGRRGLRRLFDPGVLERLALVSLARTAGFSLDEIGRMFGPGGEPRIDRRMLADNPLRGIEWPREKNPRRPVASTTGPAADRARPLARVPRAEADHVARRRADRLHRIDDELERRRVAQEHREPRAESDGGEYSIGFNPATQRIMTMSIGFPGPVWRLTPPEVVNPAMLNLGATDTGGNRVVDHNL